MGIHDQHEPNLKRNMLLEAYILYNLRIPSCPCLPSFFSFTLTPSLPTHTPWLLYRKVKRVSQKSYSKSPSALSSFGAPVRDSMGL